jgi:hypothetical protein
MLQKHPELRVLKTLGVLVFGKHHSTKPMLWVSTHAWTQNYFRSSIGLFYTYFQPGMRRNRNRSILSSQNYFLTRTTIFKRKYIHHKLHTSLKLNIIPKYAQIHMKTAEKNVEASHEISDVYISP